MTPLRTMGRRRRIALAALVVLVLLAGAAVYAYRRSAHSTPVSEARALQRFRQAQGHRAGAGRPAVGVYRYAVRGWECAGVGPLCLRRALPARGYLVVTRQPSGLQLEFEFSAEHREAVRYRLRGGARYEVWQDTFISFAGVAQEDAAPTVPASLALPATLRVGQRWSQRFHVRDLPVRSASRVLRRERLSVGGTGVSTFVIASASVTGGAHSGTEDDVTWHDPARGLDVRQTISRTIGGAFPYRLRASATLESLTPSR